MPLIKPYKSPAEIFCNKTTANCPQGIKDNVVPECLLCDVSGVNILDLDNKIVFTTGKKKPAKKNSTKKK